MRISVIIPTHNRSALVVEALRSVRAQSTPVDEVIVVDDGSDDDTGEILRSELRTNCRYLKTPNRGVSAARNLGVARSSGEWIAFLDSDDLWLPDKIRTQVDFVTREPDIEICQTNEIWIRNGVRVNSCAHHRKPTGDIFDLSLQRCLVSPSAVMLRRSLFDRVGGFDESLPACEDYDLWLRIACTTAVWLVDSQQVVKRGGHADQLSRQHWGMDRFRVAALLRMLASSTLSDRQCRLVAHVVREKCAVLSQGATKRGHDDEAQRYAAVAAWALGQISGAAPSGTTPACISHQPSTASADSTASSRSSPAGLLDVLFKYDSSASGPMATNLRHSRRSRYDVR